MSKAPAKKRKKPLFRTASESKECGEDERSASQGGPATILRKRRRRLPSLPPPPTTNSRETESGGEGAEERQSPLDDPNLDELMAGAGEILQAEGELWGGGLEGEEEDLLSGLCPEDLNFSLNASHGPHSILADHGSIPGVGRKELDREDTNQMTDVSPQPKSGRMVEGERGSEGEETANSFFGLPSLVQSLLHDHRGIHQLYAWQEECLGLPRVLDGGNLLYCLPTSGGKTLVAEILILRQLLVRDKDVLLVLPYVSLVQEKVRDLAPFALALGFAVEEYAAGRGKTPPIKRRRKRVVYVATIEKASGLVNCLAELGRLQSLGLAVVDELHMLGDGGLRGATLEACLTKILCLSSGTQVVGMSATLSNISDLASFLRADTFSSLFRPVELREFVKLGRRVFSVETASGSVSLQPCREITPRPLEEKTDPDQLVSLVTETLPQPCLVFCATKRLCQNAAILLSRHLHRFHVEQGGGPRSKLLRSLAVEAQGVCPVLTQTVPVGVAYHHSGLMADERRLIEEGFSRGELSVLCCTSTLAAGVNLPAKRVILRSPYIGNRLLSLSQYKQMVGRAGRKGLAERGDSILMASLAERDKVASLLASPFDRCDSSLLSHGSAALHSLILSLIGLKLATTTSELQTFLQATLYYQQCQDHTHFLSRCQETVASLVAEGYIAMERVEKSGNKLNATPLGRAVVKGCVPVERAGQLYRELSHAQSCLVLSTNLHLLFLATPTDHALSIRPNWLVFFKTLTGLGEDEVRVAEMAGVSPSLLSKLATGSATHMSEETSLLYQRFYLSLMMHRLISGQRSQDSGGVAGETRGVWSVAKHFQCSRGFVQSSVSSMASFATCLVHFSKSIASSVASAFLGTSLLGTCTAPSLSSGVNRIYSPLPELPELWALHLLLPSVAEQLSLSASLDLAPLLEIPGVRQGRARQLLQAGYPTPESLVGVSPADLCEKVIHLYPRQARALIQAAKALVRDKAEVLIEEAQDLMAGLT